MINFKNSIIDKEKLLKVHSTSFVSRNFFKKFNILKSFFKVSKITENNFSFISNLITKKNKRILVIGGGEVGNGFNFFNEKFKDNIISIDIYDSSNVDLIADAHDLPFKENYFDIVIIQAVLEHVLNPNVVVDEIFRVLCYDGVVYSEIPFLQQVHEGAFDYTRYTHSGHRYLFKKFSHINSGFTKGASHFFLWAIDGFACSIFRSKITGKIFKLLFFWVLYFERFIPEKFNLDFAGGTFFIGSKLKDSNEILDIVEFYRGSQK